MAIIKCKMCGGDLELIEGSSVCECEYCGTKQTVPTADNDKKLTLFARANRLRAANEFDKAAGVYENLVADFPEEAEAYWGLVLCRYGIEYVDDPATGKKIPTCHRSSFDSILEDEDFEQACENADPIARRVYRDEAKAIEDIRRGILEISGKEEPYDIFICYKETDENGERTIDSVLAQDVYDALTEKGYRVFFSRVTLEDKLGTEYEPYIFAALNSAKIMLVFGTDYENFNAVWVKNEWSRFLALIARGEKKTLIPCFKDVDAYDMPKEFRRLQAQDLGKVGAVQDLLRGIEKIIPKQGAGPVEIVQQSAVKGAFVERGMLFLEDRDYARADEYFEKALDVNPKDSMAYLGKVFAVLRIASLDEMDTKTVDLDSIKEFARAVQFSNSKTKAELQQCYDRAKKKLQLKYLCTSLTNIIKKIEREDVKKEREEKEIRIKKIQEEKKVAIKEMRKRLRPVSHLISCDPTTIVGINSNGISIGLRTYEAVLGFDKNTGKDIKGIVTYDNIFENSIGSDPIVAIHTCAVQKQERIIGLTSKGLIHIVGDPPGAYRASKWFDIKKVLTSGKYCYGLQSNGTIVCCDNSQAIKLDDLGPVDDIAAAYGNNNLQIIGLKSNGTLVSKGADQFNESRTWSNIIEVVVSDGFLLGLKSDGTVRLSGTILGGNSSTSKWDNIVSIAAGSKHGVGLKLDGTVVAVGSNENGQCNVSDWKSIVAIAAGGEITVGLKADGTVVTTEMNEHVQNEISNWKLFQNYETFETERKQVIHNHLAGQIADIKMELLTLKGLFTGKRRKDLEARLHEVETELQQL